MDKKITDFIVTELKIGKWRLAPIDFLLLVFAVVFGVMTRSCVVSYTCMDAKMYLELAEGLKIATACFDVLLSVLSGLYVYELTHHKLKAFLAYAIVIMLPVLAAGSAMWGMGDSVFVFFAVLSLYLLTKGKGNAAVIAYGVSLFLSRYAFFLLPVFAIAFMQKKTKLVSYLAPFCGAWFRNGIVTGEGRLSFPVFEAERILSLTRGENLLSYNWPNFFQVIGPDKFVMEYAVVFKSLAAVVMLAVVVLALQKNEELKAGKLISLSLLLAMVFPYIMPQMDERCGLLADILAVIFVMKYTDMYYVAIIQVIISYIAYSAYFRGEPVIALSYVAFVMLFLIVIMLRFVMNGKRLSICFKEKEN
ncbi:MAG: hypothetical protein E7289_02010 [Lachnospiraceae bacterium]|nr:hypothetical protein [Lachnospiraceae bacterium]